ncbi:hypothetical protein BDV93DRAFT_527934 [Ceratobasidium sp. AG-I]|nr:hypothetical protein BDV93DRAFT_527934 [Ceratobasidium sp. AG-I]
MILDAGPNPKSPTVSDPGSPQSSTQPGNSIFSHRSRYPASYSTFSEAPSGRANTGVYTGSVSDITGLLSQDHPNAVPGDDLPPAYNEVLTSSESRKSNRFWARFAGAFLIVILLCSTWYAYEFTKAGGSSRSPLPPSPSLSNVPSPTQPLPSSSIPTSSPSAPTPLPRPPPVDPYPDPPSKPDLPSKPDFPNKPYLSPTHGRNDLCRPWGYSSNSEPQPPVYDQTLIEHLEYIVPTFAPIYIENSAICAGCAGSVNTMDTVTARLLVIPADIPRPKVELHIQYGSEAVLENVSICMRKQPLGEGEKLGSIEDYRWVLGINTMKKLGGPGTGVLSSINVIVSLPTAQVHDLSTNLRMFTQTIGYPAGVSPYKLSFETLRIFGDYGGTEIGELSSRVVEVVSHMGNIAMAGLRVSESIRAFSQDGNVECNATLVHGHNGPPVQVDNQSKLGAVTTIASIEYPSQMVQPPVFDVASHSQFGSPWAWISDPVGTASLHAGRLPAVIPTIRANVTSTYAVTQVIVPSTYHGSLDLSSQFASVVKVDHAKNLPGRSITWYNGAGRVQRGAVQWNGRHAGEKDRGNVHVATQYAAARILLLGLDDHGVEHWPSE